MASTLLLTDIANFCSTHADLLPLTGVGGYTSEPFLSIANDAMSEIINDAQDWKWNSIELFDTILTFQPLITCSSKQDYLFAGASAFVLATSGPTSVQSSGAAIDLASASAITVTAGVVTVKTLEAHRFAIGNIVNLTGVVKKTGGAGTPANYNSTLTDNGSTSTWSTGYPITAVGTNSFSFAAVAGQTNGDALGAPGISNFGWLTGAVMMELNNVSSPPNWRQQKAVRNLPKWSRVSDSGQIAMVQDLGTGVLRFRLSYVPGSVVWAINLIYQMTSPMFTTLTYTTWSPIPDSYNALIRQAVIYRMYRYLNANAPSTQNEYKKFQQELAKSKGSDDAEESNVFLQPDALVDNYWPGGSY